MKIRCGSHQQNRSIVRPGLSLMAAKVALTAEEFRENSQRSIDLFNTEKLSTDSTRVLKSVYCNSVHFCRCNLHGACGGKGVQPDFDAAAGSCNLHGACGGKEGCVFLPTDGETVAICTERVEAKLFQALSQLLCVCCNLHGACGGKVQITTPNSMDSGVAICTERVEAKRYASFSSSSARRLQSARSVWRQRWMPARLPATERSCCNLHGACGGKEG